MKQRTGLGKQVSSIFDGVAVPTSAQSSMDRTAMPANATPVISAPQFMREDRSSEVLKTDRYRQAVSYAPPVDQRRQNTAKIMVAVLAIVFVFVIYRAFNSTSPSPAVSSVPVATVTQKEPVVQQPVEIDWKVPDPYPAVIRDPMQLPSSQSITFAASGEQPQVDTMELMSVGGIVFSDDNPSAIINGQVVYQGQKIGNVTVTKITKTAVEFKSADRTWSQKVER